MPAPLRLYNSLTRQLEAFEPLHGNEARVYTCGPTVYNYPHIGNMRAYVFADTLGRVLRWKGYNLKHVINITDVGHLTDDADAGEDKLERMAATQSRTASEIAKYYTQAYWLDFRALNCRQPAKWTVATDYILRMIAFAAGIADRHCYQLDSGLYFDVSTVPDYGRLARSGTGEGESRIDPVDGKRNFADFAIWRRTPPGETRQMEWPSPWGLGAPGWHLECSVMSGDLLGFPFDIHTGGIDHREIHHPNEIAQNQAHCNGKDSGARFWMHNNFLIDRTRKMSKSSGDFLRLQTLKYDGYHPLSYRMMCLQSYYRKELEFSWDNLSAAQTRLIRILSQADMLKRRWLSDSPNNRYAPYPRYTERTARNFANDIHLVRYIEEFDQAISNDLNTPEALPIVERLLKEKTFSLEQHLRTVRSMFLCLGLGLRDRTVFRRRPSWAKIPLSEIERSIRTRQHARELRDFATSDRIRDELALAGVEVMDGDPLGWDWKLDL